MSDAVELIRWEDEGGRPSDEPEPIAIGEMQWLRWQLEEALEARFQAEKQAAELREGLKPFARVWQAMVAHGHLRPSLVRVKFNDYPTHPEFRRAFELLQEKLA